MAQTTTFRASMRVRTALCGVLALGLAACGSETSSDAPTSEAGETASAPLLGSFGIETADMNTETAPGDDFYDYVNGGWLASFEIPAERSSYTRFAYLAERAEEQIRAIIEDAAAAEPPAGSLEQKIGDTFAAFMDVDAINAAGLAPVRDEMAAFDTMDSRDALAVGMLEPAYGNRAPVSIYVSIDAKNPDQYTVYASQSGLGLPDRDYYLSEQFADKAEAYKAFLADMFDFLEYEDARDAADRVYAFEAAIAEVHWPRAKNRNRDLTYNPYTIAEMTEAMPGLPWPAMMAKMGIPSEQEIIVRNPDAIEGAAKIFADTDIETIKDYLKVHALRSYASVLPTEIDDRVFAFFGTELSGQPEQRERWKRGVSAVSGTLGEAVGKVYVERHFPEEAKAQMDELVVNLREAFAMRLAELDWMSDATKAEAQKKLEAFTPKIGYPNEWTDYTDLTVRPETPVENIRASRVFAFNESMSKLGGPIDEEEWGMTPQTVNAYYSSTRNEIVFPAAILQAPFFDPNADPAVNYGAIGGVIGHEIGHGFDDQGRKSDGTGALRDWWTEEDAARFEEKTSVLGAQYATYEPVEGFPINPELTMGENIGDLGGLSMAYSAYQLSLDGEEAPVIDGFTGDQRFFMSWAQVWKAKYREEALKRQVATDSHSNARFRVNGVVRNMDAWYEAFGVEEDAELYLPPEERVSIW